MTKEEKQLLLKDLCVRLPYQVKVCAEYLGETPFVITGIVHDCLYVQNDIRDEYFVPIITKIKPYLRSMSSMTEEERNEAAQFEINNLGPIGFNWGLLVSNSSKLVNWLNVHHFDYHGLIPMGIAIEAPEGMYKF